MTDELDSSQRAVIDALVAPCAISVIGAPRTGKTSLLEECVAEVLARDPQAQVAVLSPDRRAATGLRNAISVRLGALGSGVTIQSITAFAFSLYSTYAQAVGRRAPELLTGADQDVIIKDIVDLVGDGFDPGFPHFVNEEVRGLAAFRAEIRDLLTRAAELELSPRDLERLGTEHGKPFWVAGARMMEKYELALAQEAGSESDNPDRTDHARLVSQAAAAFTGWDAGIEASPVPGRLDVERPHFDWVFIDDVQNATLSTLTLLRALQSEGTSVVLFGDPDDAVQGYRGGIPELPVIATMEPSAGGLGASRIYLGTRYSGGGALARAVTRVTSGIHTSGAARQRTAEFAGVELRSGWSVETREFKNADDEVLAIARHLRKLHLRLGVPYAQMAVLTRSHSGHEEMRRALVRHGVPVQTVASSLPLRDKSAVAALLALIDLALKDPDEVAEADVRAVLTGRLVALDPLRLRQLSRQLRGWEMKAGSNRPVGKLLLGLVLDGPEPVDEVPELARVRRLIGAIRAAAARPDALAEDVLWAAWDGVGVADSWQQAALGRGVLADAANDDLDSVIQLFRVAQRIADRDPSDASIGVLLELLNEADLPEDSIARTGSATEEVTLATPSSVIGRAFSHVVIAGLNNRAWPNTRLRNPLTQVPELVSLVLGPILGTERRAEQLHSEVLDDELRLLLHALTRASDSVLVTAVESADARPSTFFEWLREGDAEAGELDDEVGEASEIAAAELEPVDPAELVGVLRRTLALADLAAVAGDDKDSPGWAMLRDRASSVLEQLAAAEVPGTNPIGWADVLEPSSDAAAITGVDYISPSGVEGTVKCPLSAFFRMVGGEPSTSTSAADIGSLIHEIAEKFPRGGLDGMIALFEVRYAGFDVGEDYFSQAQMEQSLTLVKSLNSYLESADEPIATEVEYSAELAPWGDDDPNRIRVNARLDRLEAAGDAEGVRVVDFKTGSTKVTVAAAQEHPQLLVYQWLVEGSGGQNVVGVDGTEVSLPGKSAGAQLVYLHRSDGEKTTLRKQEPLDDRARLFAELLLTTAARQRRGPEYFARSEDCSYCKFKRVCPAWTDGKVLS